MSRVTRFVDLPAAHPGRRLLTGATPWFAAQADQRFSYRLFVPEDLRDDEPPLRLWVFVHGTGRGAELYLDAFADQARAARAAVMTPLFPAGVMGPDDVDNYKSIECSGIRFDAILLGMVDEVADRWPVDTARFFLHGFSGGGQFAHRFAYLHPGRLSAVSIGAPGQVTLPTTDQAWPHGIGDVEQLFGVEPDREAIRRLSVQVVVGSLDDDPADFVAARPEAAPVGRLTKATALAEALKGFGVQVRLDVVDGVGHDGAGVIPVVADFLRRELPG